MKSIAAASLPIAAALLALLPGEAGSADAHSPRYRLIASGPASVSATAQSPVYAVHVVGGTGQPVGISASPGHSVVVGGTSNQLPTARIFRDGLEGD